MKKAPYTEEEITAAIIDINDVVEHDPLLKSDESLKKMIASLQKMQDSEDDALQEDDFTKSGKGVGVLKLATVLTLLKTEIKFPKKWKEWAVALEAKAKAKAPKTAAKTPKTPKTPKPKAAAPKADKPKEDKPKEDKPKEDKADKPKADKGKKDKKDKKGKEDKPAKEDKSDKEDKPKAEAGKRVISRKDRLKFMANLIGKDGYPRKDLIKETCEEFGNSKVTIQMDLSVGQRELRFDKLIVIEDGWLNSLAVSLKPTSLKLTSLKPTSLKLTSLKLTSLRSLRKARSKV